MGANCCKFLQPKNKQRPSRKRIRDYFLAKLSCFRRNRVEPILIQQMSADGSEVNINRRLIDRSTLSSPVIVTRQDTAGVASESHVVVNDQLKLKLISLDNKDVGNGSNATMDTRNRKVRPKAAKGGRSITQLLPTFVQELEQDVETLLYGNSTITTTNEKRPLKAADGMLEDTALPGQVITSEKYFCRTAPSRPHLTVQAIKTTEQKCLENFMLRQTRKELDIDSD